MNRNVIRRAGNAVLSWRKASITRCVSGDVSAMAKIIADSSRREVKVVNDLAIGPCGGNRRRNTKLRRGRISAWLQSTPVSMTAM